MSLLKSKFNFRRSLPGIRCYCDLRRQHPFYKTLDVLKIPLPFIQRGEKQARNRNIEHADVVIIGAGSIGASTAYWLKMKAGKGLSVAVIDKDLTFKNHTKYLSMGGMHQHYSLIENILLSQYTAEFLRTVNDSLGPTVDLKYVPNRNLVMASEKYAELLEHNITIQMENGIRNEKLLPSKLKAKYPWLNVDDIQLGCVGLEFEGWFDSKALHYGFLSKSVELGAQYIEGEVKEFRKVLQRDLLMEGVKQGTYNKVNELIYTTPDGVESSIRFAVCVLAAGPDSKEISELLDIGKGSDLLMVPLPVERRHNRVYCIENDNSQLSINMPMVKDVNGMWIRRNGIRNNYICGHHPLVPANAYDELSDEEYFTNIIQTSLAHRIPCLKDSKVLFTKKEVCDYNVFDESGYIGIHPYYNNMVLANGFGTQGVVHSPGLGRAAAEIIIDSKFVSIDLTRFCFDRLLTVDPIVEVNCY